MRVAVGDGASVGDGKLPSPSLAAAASGSVESLLGGLSGPAQLAIRLCCAAPEAIQAARQDLVEFCRETLGGNFEPLLWAAQAHAVPVWRPEDEPGDEEEDGEGDLLAACSLMYLLQAACRDAGLALFSFFLSVHMFSGLRELLQSRRRMCCQACLECR